MPRSPFGRDLWNVYGLASHETCRAERATLTREREARRFATDLPHFTVHARDAAHAIQTVARRIREQRNCLTGLPDTVDLHTACGVPVLVPPPRW